MSNLDDYNTKLEVIRAIPDDQIKIPNSIPVSIYIHEAGSLYKWCQDDKEELTAKGLDWTVVEDLPIRCGALIESEANWQIKQQLRIFWRNPARLKGYRSDYRRRLNKRSSRRYKVSKLEPGYVPITVQE